jgi:hypothetical protein
VDVLGDGVERGKVAGVKLSRSHRSRLPHSGSTALSLRDARLRNLQRPLPEASFEQCSPSLHERIRSASAVTRTFVQVAGLQ